MRLELLYPVAIMVWATRRTLPWRLSNNRNAGFCVAALEEASARFGKPEILRPSVVGLRLNTDQGNQISSFAFNSVLRDAEVRINMDG